LLDDLKTMGFLYATKAGVSIGIDDMVTPPSKKGIIEKALKEVENFATVRRRYNDRPRATNKVTAIWSDVTDHVSKEMFIAMHTREKERKD
jgi:DNA-directed RNA polymerase subunit beta'